MRILLLGGGGQCGTELIRRAPAGWVVVSPRSHELDITNQAALEALDGSRFDGVINAAAYTAVDQAESETQRAFAVNSDAAAFVAGMAAAWGVPLVHLSTDYVFDGSGSSPYSELHSTNPRNVYGMSKLSGELMVSASGARAVILRTSWVFSAHGSNFVKTMLRLAGDRDSLRIVNDQIGTPTWAGHIADRVWSILGAASRTGDVPHGIFHFAGEPSCSWKDFAVAITGEATRMSILRRAPTIEGIPSSEYPTPARRPAYSVLDCSKAEHRWGASERSWGAGLTEVLTELRGRSGESQTRP